MSAESSSRTPGKSSWIGLYDDHPVRPVTGIDPLATNASVQADFASGAATVADLRIGYGELWEPEPKLTWSGTSWALREALQRITETVDIGVTLSARERFALRALSTRHRRGRLTAPWRTSRLTQAYVSSAIRRGLREKSRSRPCDAVVMAGPLALAPGPFFPYEDCSWDSLLTSPEAIEWAAAMRMLKPADMYRLRDRQVAIYERAATVFTMSHWMRRALIEQSGLAPEKVHVIHPGSTSVQTSIPARGAVHEPTPAVRLGSRRRLLYIGRAYEAHDVYRKGGDLVVAALAILRRDYDPDITLTMVGMDTWLLPGDIPEGVHLRGALPRSEIKALYDSHDLFVMPSRMEPFGIVFAEALSRGLPVVARNAFAMPEIVTSNVSGELVDKDDAHELAAVIAKTLANDEIYRLCAERAPSVAAYFSWDRAAREMVQVIADKIGW